TAPESGCHPDRQRHGFVGQCGAASYVADLRRHRCSGVPAFVSATIPPPRTPMNPNRTVALASSLVCAAFTVALATSALAQDGTIYPLDAPPEPNAIPLNTGGVEGQTAPESWFRQWGDPMVRNVSAATLTPFLPEPGRANGAAVIVAPGGGFRWLSMGNEGWEVAEALRARGIAAFVLKYRLNPTPESLDDFRATMNPNPGPGGNPSAAPQGGAPTPPPRRDLSN